MFLTGTDADPSRGRVSGTFETMEILVGPRFLERLSVRVGLSIDVELFFPKYDLWSYTNFGLRLQVSVPLGRRR